MASLDSDRRAAPQAAWVAWASIAVNIFLSPLNLAIAAASGSLAVAAEIVHNLVDLVASVAVLPGSSSRNGRTATFPTGCTKWRT
jgi:divalent metal cation (Fe/Co/Zn/Cd) transporter